MGGKAVTVVESSMDKSDFEVSMDLRIVGWWGWVVRERFGRHCVACVEGTKAWLAEAAMSMRAMVYLIIGM